MAIEYLGNKSRLLEFVLTPITSLPGIKTVADLFCGTASVSKALKAHGLRVVANDHMELCATLAEAALLAEELPGFRGLESEIQRHSSESMYQAVLRTLNELPPVDGFFYQTYSPASAATGAARMYLTEVNAGKLDAMRGQIENWTQFLSRAERAILLRDLVHAASAVSNTAGTYGCYLKTWKQRALQPLALVPDDPAPLPFPPHGEHEISCDDAEAIAENLGEIDAVYLDPPYTKRQYAAYYHLLETLVSGSSPLVEGSTGLPRWRDKQSDFCYRRKAPAALQRIIDRLAARHILLSYSADGHITHDEIMEILNAKGDTRWWEQSSPRYRSSALVHRATSVRERLYHVAVR